MELEEDYLVKVKNLEKLRQSNQGLVRKCFEGVYLVDIQCFLDTFWYHWKALSMYFQNMLLFSQLH